MLGRRKLVLGGAAGLALACTPSPRLSARRTTHAREVAQLVSGRRSVDGAGVSLLRLLGTPALPHLDPFVLLDEIHSSDPREYEAGFPTHPHRGFETVTIMLEGRMRHRDSRGNAGLIEGGGSQWMTAGSGILHSEMPERPGAGGSTELWGFQLWVNLPEAERWRTPEYQDLSPDRLAEVELDRGGRLRLIAGEALGARGPVAPRATEPLLCTLSLAAGDELELELPREHAAMVVVGEGTAAIGTRRQRVEQDSLVVTSEGSRLLLGASEGPAQLVVIAGQPLREPFVHRGPFVMGTMEEVEQAFADYRAGRLG